MALKPPDTSMVPPEPAGPDPVVIFGPPAYPTFTPAADVDPPPVAIDRVSVSTLNQAARFPTELRANKSAYKEPLAIIYGNPRVACPVVTIAYKSASTEFVFLCVIGQGEIQSVDSVYVNGVITSDADEGLVAAKGGSLNTYVGNQTQNADALLVSAIGAGYTDNLRGIAYLVIAVPRTELRGIPKVEARVKGLKVSDPRTSPPTVAYSDNPALCLADFITDTEYGMGLTLDTTSVGTVATSNDGSIGSPAEARRRLWIALNRTLGAWAWVEVLQDYASAFVWMDGDTVTFVNDRTAASIYTFDDTNIIAGTAQWTKGGVNRIPTDVEIRWFDHADGKTRAAMAIGGTARTKMMSAAMPGVPTYAQAQRMAVERYNHAVLEDLTGSIVVLQDAIENVTVGDVCTVNDPVNGVNQDFRIMGIDLVGTGRYQLQLREYQASAYSDVVPADPGAPDTDLPSPLSIPQVGNVTATKNEILTGDGIRQTRLNVTWDVPTFGSPAQNWPFADHYEIQVLTTAASPDVLVFTGTSIDNEWQSPPILDGVAYLARVRIINTLGQAGPWSTDTITPTLDTTAPATPATPVAVQGAGDFINVDWAANTDADLWYYNLYRNVNGGAFSLVGRVGGNATQYWDGAYGAAYRFKVTAVDRAGNESSQSAQSNSVAYDKNIDELHIEDDGVSQAQVSDATVDTDRRVDADSNTWTSISLTPETGVTKSWTHSLGRKVLTTFEASIFGGPLAICANGSTSTTVLGVDIFNSDSGTTHNNFSVTALAW